MSWWQLATRITVPIVSVSPGKYSCSLGRFIDESTINNGSINGMTVDDLLEFRMDWYVRDLYGSGPAEAVENYGIGEEVTDWSDIQPGDFVQFWRNSGSGHNTIFIDWETDNQGEIIGVYYWSTQGSTDGIGYRAEYFGNGTYDLDLNTSMLQESICRKSGSLGTSRRWLSSLIDQNEIDHSHTNIWNRVLKGLSAQPG